MKYGIQLQNSKVTNNTRHLLDQDTLKINHGGGGRIYTELHWRSKINHIGSMIYLGQLPASFTDNSHVLEEKVLKIHLMDQFILFLPSFSMVHYIYTPWSK